MKKNSKILLAAFASLALFAFSASAATHTFTINLDVAQAAGSAAMGGTGSGTGTATYDDVTGFFSYSYTYMGLAGTVGNSHFHGPAAPGVGAGPIAEVPIPAMAMSPVSGGPHMITPQQGQDLINGLWYLNIHTSQVPSGEIRGQLINNNPPANNTALIASLEKKIKKLKKKAKALKKKGKSKKAKKLKKKAKKLQKTVNALS